MATKRDRKTAFPFIKPKGSIKKDVQQFRCVETRVSLAAVVVPGREIHELAVIPFDSGALAALI